MFERSSHLLDALSTSRAFATLLVYYEPFNVRKLWEDFLEPMSKDFKRIHGDSMDTQILGTLKSINFFFESVGKCIKDYDLPSEPTNPTESMYQRSREIDDEMVVEIPKEDNSASLTLNPEQKTAYETILDRVISGGSNVFFINDPRGIEKTYLYRALLDEVRRRGMIALATAMSSVAASIMPEGQTTHSCFKILILANEITLCNMSKQSRTVKLISRTKIIIWDEAPMAKRFAVETLDRSLKDIMNYQESFRGKVIVFGGDFRKVLPIVPKGTRAKTVSASLVRSYL
ncbi:hypothetical protein L1049_015239 [Liquidambar formosana]|uniref:ATP-dependent DNA helicase n=1 Tax=Liquidambar formosana TaxID=63359 RepID=A0AAP0S3Y5_LIQFO